MFKPALRVVQFGLCAIALGAAAPAVAQIPYGQYARSQAAQSDARYAAIVVDANSGEVLFSRSADSPRYPASITKVMTLYLTFEALSRSELRLNDRIAISAHAASMAPTKLGLRPGSTITVDDAIRAIALKSANDIAVAMAEHLGGSESRFAALMTLRAQELGMTNTRFVNACGLPDKRQLSSARDIAIMSRAVMRDFPQYYSYFGQRSFSWNGQQIRNHNHLLDSMPGVDGLKTGFTNASGYNLAASAVRGNRRLIAVVMGGRSGSSRDSHVQNLLETGFTVMARRDRGESITVAQSLFGPSPMGPVERAIGQGDESEGRGLKIVVRQDLPGPSAARNIPRSAPRETHIAAPRGLKVAMAEPKAPVAIKAAAKARATAKADKESLDKLAKARAEADCAKVKGAKAKKACKTEATDVKLAAAADCAKAKTAKAKQACKADALKLAAKDEKKGKAAKGGWAVQVGAFKAKGDAKAQLAKMAKAHSGKLADAGAEVSGKGMYRARFTGLTADEAKAACKAISAKGQKCLALAVSS